MTSKAIQNQAANTCSTIFSHFFSLTSSWKQDWNLFQTISYVLRKTTSAEFQLLKHWYLKLLSQWLHDIHDGLIPWTLSKTLNLKDYISNLQKSKLNWARLCKASRKVIKGWDDYQGKANERQQCIFCPTTTRIEPFHLEDDQISHSPPRLSDETVNKRWWCTSP